MRIFDRLNPSRYETMLRAHAAGAGPGMFLAGVSRSLRFDFSVSDDDLELPTATGLVAPLVFLYVDWLLRQAVEQGRKRLYFLARDAQILKKVADIVVHERKLDIECRYLYCSRESLLLASYAETAAFERNWITWGYLSSITIGELARRINLTPDCLAPYAAGTPVQRYCAAPELPVAQADRSALAGFLARSEVSTLIREAARPRYELTLAYLQQEGLADPIPYALVDTGWRGSSQYAISALLAKAGIYPEAGIAGYYLGLNGDAWQFGADELRGFLFDWRHEGRDDLLYNFLCFEMLFSAEHGRTTGYSHCGDRVEPVMNDFDAIEHEKRLIRSHHRAAVEFAQRVVPHVDTCAAAAPDTAELARSLMRSFIGDPSPVEAEAYGAWLMASEIREQDSQPMAPPMRFGMFCSVVSGRAKIRGYWPQASLIRGGLRVVALAYNLFLRTSLLEWYRRHVLRY